jgi:hypothetical protein
MSSLQQASRLNVSLGWSPRCLEVRISPYLSSNDLPKHTVVFRVWPKEIFYEWRLITWYYIAPQPSGSGFGRLSCSSGLKQAYITSEIHL